MYSTNNIRKERKEKKHSQEIISKMLDVSRSSYSMWELGSDIFPIKRLIDLCNIYEISIDYALDLTNKTEKIKGDYSIATFSKRLKEFRKENKLTQEKLAAYLHTNKSVICNYEKGRYFITTPFLYDICKKYGISADYLIGRIDNPKYIKT